MAVFRNVLNGIAQALRSFRGAQLGHMSGTGFWEGRQFRAYFEFAQGTGVLVLRLVATQPFLLQYEALTVHKGEVLVEVRTSSTPSGTWTALPDNVQGKYRIGVTPVSTISLSTGGSITGGVVREPIRIIAGTGGSVKAATSVSSITGERGLPAGTYYIRIECTGTTEGMFVLEWEDLNSDGS